MADKLYNGGKFNRRNLGGDKVTFRWGGFTGEFNKTADEWREEYDTFCGDERNPYEYCSVCNKLFGIGEYVYAGEFIVAPKEVKYRHKFKMLCRECAYRISDAVIEDDGEKHQCNRGNGK